MTDDDNFENLLIELGPDWEHLEVDSRKKLLAGIGCGSMTVTIGAVMKFPDMCRNFLSRRVANSLIEVMQIIHCKK